MRALIVVVLACGLMGCGKLPAVRDCSVARAGQTRLVAFGDSQTMGVAAHIGFCEYSYAFVMAERLNLNILNRAIGGTTLEGAGSKGPSQYDMIMGTVFAPTDTVVFMPAFNDIARYGNDPVALARFQTVLTGLLTLMSGQVTHIYVATPLWMLNYQSPIFTKGSDAAYDLYVQAIKDATQGLANVSVLETKTLFSISSSDVMDHIHINPEAQFRLGNSLLGAL